MTRASYDDMNNATQTTSDLFDATNKALIEQRWSDARRLLDDLGLRNDNPDWLCPARSYGVPDMLLGVIGDRIELVNAKAGRA